MRYLWRLRPYLRAYWLQMLLALITLFGITAASLAIPAIIRLVIDYGLTGGQSRLLLLSSLTLLVVGLVRAGLTYLQRYLSEWIAAHVGYDLRNRLYDHIQNLSFTYHDHSQTGQLISRCIEDVRAIERFMGSGVIELIRLGLLLVGIGSLLFWQEPRLAAIGMLPLIPLMLVTTHFGRRIGKLFLVVDNTLGELSSRLQENVSGAQVVRAFAREPFEMDRFDEANRDHFTARIQVMNEWSRVMPASIFLVTLGTISILLFGGEMALRGEITIGTIVSFNAYLLLLSAPAQQLTWVVNSAGEARAGVERTFEILDTRSEIQSPPKAVVLPSLTGKVEFKQVSFHYSSGNNQALEDIDLVVEPNQVIALIGPTGSGKTSLVNLIPRFYDVSSGAVQVDGIDVRQAELISLRRQIGIVLQTSLLFSTSIYENIAYGKPEANQEEVLAAARAAQADSFIKDLPQGYETVVGERGITLSGGQRQRIAIARALLMDPRILILDDSTSSVDTSTERLIQAALANLMEGRTTFVIAHRLSTVQRADLILVMDAGRIVERGAHEQLLARPGGLYRQIYEIQLRDQELVRGEIEQISSNTAGSPPEMKD